VQELYSYSLAFVSGLRKLLKIRPPRNINDMLLASLNNPFLDWNISQ